MAEAVFTADTRVTFVEVSASDVGTGKKYPAAVTLDQIAEIYFRVKDIKFSGNFTWDWDYIGGPYPMTFTSPASMPMNRTVDEGIQMQTRGYSLQGEYIDNNAEYDAGVGFFYSDIGDRERALWRTPWNTTADYASHLGTIPHYCVTAFTYYGYHESPPDSTWWGYGEFGGFVMARMGRNVAVVKNTPESGLLDPANLYYLEFEFAWYDFTFPVNFGGGTNIYDGINGDVSGGYISLASGDYIIRLQSGDILIPIYQFSGDSSNHTCSVIHEATEWFPYSKGSPATPVWDSTTGAKL